MTPERCVHLLECQRLKLRIQVVVPCQRAAVLLSRGDEIEQAFPGQDAATEPSLSNRDTLERMLRNLTSSLSERKDHEKLEQVGEFLQLLSDFAPAAEQ